MSKFNEFLNIRGMSDNEKTPSISNFRLQFAIIYFFTLSLFICLSLFILVFMKYIKLLYYLNYTTKALCTKSYV